tara:strand:+ start:702 stop:1001 length:300 start_codon:yes stop_codon:yes gene_type:complete
MKARNKQIGGDHYKRMSIQPSDYIVKNKLGWYEGNIVKYITRHSIKGGKLDVEKVIHYAQLLIEDRYTKKETEGERMGRVTAKHVKKLNKQWKKERESK